MAKMASLIKFTGGLGDLIAYRVRGQIRLRSKPEKVRQTAATKRAAKDFGSASRTAAILRHGIAKEIILYHDDSFANRLNKAMIEVIKSDVARPAGRRQVTNGSLQGLQGFQTNKYKRIICNYAVQRLYDGSLQVTVNEPLRQFHDKVHHMQFRAVAVLPDFERGGAPVACSETVTISDVQAKSITDFCLTIPAPHNGAAVVILEAIACIIENGKPLQMGYRNYNAADIIAIVPAAKKRAPGQDYPPAMKASIHSNTAPKKVKGANPG